MALKPILEEKECIRQISDNGWILINDCDGCAVIVADRKPDDIFLDRISAALNRRFSIKIVQADQLSDWAQLVYGNNSCVLASKKNDDINDNLRAIISSAIKQNASDFYLELTQTDCKTFFRVNGRITKKETNKLEFGKNLLSIIKNTAQISLDDTDKPQESRFSITIDGNKINCRVSSISSEDSKNVVIRFLPNEFAFSIDSIGMPTSILSDIKSIAESEIGGMMLFAGPTGSGKTTTLYSLIKYLNSSNKKILTLEDPVEADIDGVIQIEICEQAGLTFESGLKAILRQDPDVIMIGEIRDIKTAEIAIHAASCGHLVLATIHATSSNDTLLRCTELGIDEISANTVLLSIMTQELIPIKCSCNKTCQLCNGSGYSRREARFNLMNKQHYQ